MPFKCICENSKILNFTTICWWDLSSSVGSGNTYISFCTTVLLHTWIVLMAHVALMSSYDKHHRYYTYIYIYTWMKTHISAQRCVMHHRFVKSGFIQHMYLNWCKVNLIMLYKLPGKKIGYSSLRLRRRKGAYAIRFHDKALTLHDKLWDSHGLCIPNSKT
jgi:hypothetical protein